MQVYKDGQVAHYKQIFSQVSFPASGPSDEFLAEQDAYKVNVFIDHDRATQKLVPAEPYIEDGWAYTVTVADKTEDEIAADTDARAAHVRAQRDRLLAASDWTQVLDAPVDRTAWATYRQALRDLPQAEGFPDVDMPRDPDWVEPAGNIEG
jgi:hypothetical protein